MQAPSTARSFAASSPTQISLRTDDGVELDARHWAQPDGARTTDLLIPASEARRLYDAVHEPRRLDVVPRMGHAFQPQLREPLLAALAWTRRFAT